MPRVWSEDDILYAIMEWEEKHGRPPVCNDWLQSNGDEHPSLGPVYRLFGSWNEAIRQAGFTPYESPRIEIDEELARRLRNEGLSDAAIARRLDISVGVLTKRIGKRPKPIPVGKKRSREQRIADLRKALQEGG